MGSMRWALNHRNLLTQMQQAPRAKDDEPLLAASPLLQDCGYYFAVGFALAEFHDGAN